ncbi:HAD family hydrolase, partial [Lactobacillus sp. XV13L]|nr:HAD family hydrolase [Lactobacillus sp. XV13L]
LMVGTGLGAKKGILIKNGEILEAANNLDTIVFDKTGTITAGKPQVTDVVGEKQQVLQLAASLESLSEHPLAPAILAAAKRAGVKNLPAADFKAVEGQGIQGKINGKEVFIGKPKQNLADDADSELQAKVAALQKEAKTVVLVTVGQSVAGAIAIQDAPKADARKALADLKRRGLETVMLTGDNKQVAQSIAAQVGIDRVIAEVLPIDKANAIKDLQKDKHVAFV